MIGVIRDIGPKIGLMPIETIVLLKGKKENWPVLLPINHGYQYRQDHHEPQGHQLPQYPLHPCHTG